MSTRAESPDLTEVEHEITVAAPAEEVYRLLADVENWPRLFPPTIFVEREELDDQAELIRIWATANGEPKHWTSRRTLDPAALRIEFRQQVSTPPVARMGGTWIVERHPEGARVRLRHDYRAVDDDPVGLAWIDEAVDRNSRTELAALKSTVESLYAAREWTFSFEDSVEVDGSAHDVYDFIDRADLWALRLPHVAEVRLEEPAPGLQNLRMDTRAKDGSTHTTESYRVCLPHHRIAYKQVTLPALMDLHTGVWTFTEQDGVTTATSQHTVVLRTENIAAVLGADATVARAREYVTTALSTNSLATLGHAKAHAEQRRG
ncbi:aromatase/cyclase [Actinosynnema sp. NPDC023587]|uniref:aromatase/cyclase n=1 Tax=Actinosynnema sp. NPDC023587 TaxID=3154695 RepID=UPI0033E2882A